MEHSPVHLRLALPLLVSELGTLIESAWRFDDDENPVAGDLPEDDPDRILAEQLLAAIRAITPIVGPAQTGEWWLHEIIKGERAL